jgi:hypothetical protein
MKPEQLRASILKASSPKPIRLEVEGIGPVFVKVQTAYDADVNRKRLDAAKKDDNCEIGRLLAIMLCDEEGNPLFDLADDATAMQLAKLPGSVQSAILDASNKANTSDPKS